MLPRANNSIWEQHRSFNSLLFKYIYYILLLYRLANIYKNLSVNKRIKWNVTMKLNKYIYTAVWKMLNLFNIMEMH